MRLKSRILLTALCLLAATAQAQSLRCKNDFVKPGDSKLAVLDKCGEPALRDSFCKPVEAASPASVGRVVSTVPCEKVDEWSYKPGRGQFITILRFEQGEVRSIKYGSRIP